MAVTEEMMRKQNLFLKFRVSFSDLQAKILWIILQKEGIPQTKICQALNGHDKWFCKYCYPYANAWKRRYHRTFQPSCAFKFGLVMANIRGLERKGIVKRVRTRVTDKWHSRGWDWMQCCFVQKNPVSETAKQTSLIIGDENA